jgi:uncharacterized protein involved in exopolysaccharide biosynthesis
MNQTPTQGDHPHPRIGTIELVMSGGFSNERASGFSEFLRSIWRGKWFIAGVTGACTLLSIAIALWLPNEYEAQIVLMPTSNNSGAPALSRLAGQLGGLANLGGLGLLGQDKDDKATLTIELIKSWGYQEFFIRTNQLEVALLAARGWNSQDNTLEIDPDIYDVENKKWVKTFRIRGNKTQQPGGWDIHEGFSKKMSITQDKKTGFITLRVRHYSPFLAKDWAEKIVASVNQQLQKRDRDEAEKSIKYLESKMAQTSLTEMKTALARLIEEQTKSLMLADISDEYALKTLSPAKVPEKKESPKRALIVALGMLAGLILSIGAWQAFTALQLFGARSHSKGDD